MVELVESFLQYSRLQGRITVQTESLDLGALAAEVVEELRPQALRKGLRLLLHRAPVVRHRHNPQLCAVDVVLQGDVVRQ